MIRTLSGHLGSYRKMLRLWLSPSPLKRRARFQELLSTLRQATALTTWRDRHLAWVALAILREDREFAMESRLCRWRLPIFQ
jgi:hypothetical protein